MFQSCSKLRAHSSEHVVLLFIIITLYYILPPTSHEKVLNARRRPDSRNSRNKVLFTHHDLAAQLRYTGSKPLIKNPKPEL